jgi:hypothetical protein
MDRTFAQLFAGHRLHRVAPDLFNRSYNHFSCSIRSDQGVA